MSTVPQKKNTLTNLVRRCPITHALHRGHVPGLEVWYEEE